LSEAPPLEEPASTFPPIKEYAFLSDCHTGALVAPDGTIEWLCVPRFDAPSIFGTLLDRGAGGFRLGPYGVQVPGARRYEPGTNILETTWMTPTGWAVAREALCIGPWRDVEDQVTPHSRPPVDHDASHVLVRTIECVQGTVNTELICEPLFDYGKTPAEWTMAQGAADQADAMGGDVTVRLTTDMRMGIEGNRARARHLLQEGEKRYCALSWSAVLDAPKTAVEIREDILQNGCRDNVFRHHYDTDALDASVLLIPLVRFLPATDKRVHQTVHAIDRELTEHGLVLRYKVDETDDGLSGKEGTFAICTFWLVSALSEIGDSKRAAQLLDKMLDVASPLQLFAEEIDATSGRHLGNYPQAFTHLALINAVVHVIADEANG
jgi:GH15 family glucan-1,4-alpha-glucosidase